MAEQSFEEELRSFISYKAETLHASYLLHQLEEDGSVEMDELIKFIAKAHLADKQAYALEVLEGLKNHYWSGDEPIGLTANDIRADIDQAIQKINQDLGREV